MAVTNAGWGNLSAVADGGDAHVFDTAAAYTGGNLAIFANNGVTKAYFAYDGDLTAVAATFSGAVACATTLAATGNFSVNTSKFIVTAASGLCFINDTANANMTVGLTLNQGGSDDEITAWKSSDVAHGMTTRLETDTFGCVKKAIAADGGLIFAGATAGTVAVEIDAYETTNNTTKTTAGSGAFDIRCSKKSGTTTGAMDADANLMVIRDYTTTRFIFDAEGSGHADVEWTTYDTHDDALMLRDLEATLVPDVFGAVMKYDRAFFEREGLLHDVRQEPNGKMRGMLNQTKLLMLLTGAASQIRQAVTDALAELVELNPGLRVGPTTQKLIEA